MYRMKLFKVYACAHLISPFAFCVMYLSRSMIGVDGGVSSAFLNA